VLTGAMVIVTYTQMSNRQHRLAESLSPAPTPSLLPDGSRQPSDQAGRIGLLSHQDQSQHDPGPSTQSTPTAAPDQSPAAPAVSTGSPTNSPTNSATNSATNSPTNSATNSPTNLATRSTNMWRTCPSWRRAWESVLVVVWVKHLPNLHQLDFFKAMYEAFGEVVFYSDVTMCHHRSVPCTGKKVDMQKYPAEVVWLDNVKGGWFMQHLLLHALRTRPSRFTGYLLATDDSVMRSPDMVDMPKDAFWSPPLTRLNDREAAALPPSVIAFANASSPTYQANLKHNVGGTSRVSWDGSAANGYAVSRVQPDFFYLPARHAPQWSALARQMTQDFNLTFTHVFTSWIGMMHIPNPSKTLCFWGRMNATNAFRREQPLCPAVSVESPVAWVQTVYAQPVFQPKWWDLRSLARFVHPIKMSQKANQNKASAYFRAAAVRDCS